MSDMGNPKYVQDEWVNELLRRAKVKRDQARMLSREADLLEEIAVDFEGRVAEHRKHKPSWEKEQAQMKAKLE